MKIPVMLVMVAVHKNAPLCLVLTCVKLKLSPFVIESFHGHPKGNSSCNTHNWHYLPSLSLVSWCYRTQRLRDASGIAGVSCTVDCPFGLMNSYRVRVIYFLRKTFNKFCYSLPCTVTGGDSQCVFCRSFPLPVIIFINVLLHFIGVATFYLLDSSNIIFAMIHWCAMLLYVGGF